MATAQVISPSVVNTHLNYYLETADGGGDKIVYVGTAGDRLRKHDVRPAEIHDMRRRDFDLDRNGFQLVEHASCEKTFDSEERVKTVVYEETSELLKKATGASRVHPFSHIIRRQEFQAAIDKARTVDPSDLIPFMTPAMYVHVDQSYTGAVQMLEQNLPAEEAKKLATSRWGIINVWRPIERTVTREPLAVCDASTVLESDLREVNVILPQKGGGNFADVSKGESLGSWNIAANPEHRWYYASGITTSETLLVKCFDSKKDGRARRSPHSAFQMENDSGPPRQSIEVRCLVFWEDQETE